MGGKPDFAGWATKYNIKCGDDLIIRKDAFKECDGAKVPIFWDHQHNDVENVLGHGILECRDEGVYVRGYLNDTEGGETAKKLLAHGDIEDLSIYANRLRKNGNDVIHGMIREVSLVMAGCNPGAGIEYVSLGHGEDFSDCECIMHSGEGIDIPDDEDDDDDINNPDEGGEDDDDVSHSDDKGDGKMAKEEDKKTSEKEETVQDVINSMTEKQQNVLFGLVAAAEEAAGKKSSEDDDNEGGKDMKHNAFEGSAYKGAEGNELVLSHSDEQAIIAKAKENGSFKKAFKDYMQNTLQHADGDPVTPTYGIDGINLLFPDYKMMDTDPQFVQRDRTWCDVLMGAVRKVPFSRIKSMFANITEDAARARGYIKGTQKLTEVFPLLSRTTDPQTVYKLQKLDRDDILDVKDFNIVAFLWKEMRVMLDEEIARAVLVGDGRTPGSQGSISADHIRPIWTDDDFYTIKELITFAPNASDNDKARAFIKKCVKARKNYKGSGNPKLFTTEDMLTDMLLIEDTTGRTIYTLETLKQALRVSDIQTVPVMENLSRTVSGVARKLEGLIVNPKDYTIGADRGGEITNFEDFDINFNQYEYLLETRCSGALTVPYSAIAIESTTSAQAEG